MKHLFIFLICLTSQVTIAQDSAEYEKTLKTFQENFNSQDIDAIYDLYTSDTQESMTKEGITGFVKGCYELFGEFKKATFTKSAEGVNTYEAIFDKANLEIEMKLDGNLKIISLQFQEL